MKIIIIIVDGFYFAKMICTYFSNNAFKIFNVQKFLLSLAIVVVQILLEIFRSYMPK